MNMTSPYNYYCPKGHELYHASGVATTSTLFVVVICLYVVAIVFCCAGCFTAAKRRKSVLASQGVQVVSTQAQPVTVAVAQ